MLQLSEVLKGMLTPLIAIIATYVAWQQWKTNKQKLDLERYERRLRVYNEVIGFLSLFPTKNVSIYELSKFRAATAEADFLFGPEIPEYIDEICSHWRELWVFHQEYRDYTQELPVGYDHQKVSNGIRDHSTWIAKELDSDRPKDKFKKYLNIIK